MNVRQYNPIRVPAAALLLAAALLVAGCSAAGPAAKAPAPTPGGVDIAGELGELGISAPPTSVNLQPGQSVMSIVLNEARANNAGLDSRFGHHVLITRIAPDQWRIENMANRAVIKGRRVDGSVHWWPVRPAKMLE
jgi:hypothetical protein